MSALLRTRLDTMLKHSGNASEHALALSYVYRQLLFETHVTFDIGSGSSPVVCRIGVPHGGRNGPQAAQSALLDMRKNKVWQSDVPLRIVGVQGEQEEELGVIERGDKWADWKAGFSAQVGWLSVRTAFRMTEAKVELDETSKKTLDLFELFVLSPVNNRNIQHWVSVNGERYTSTFVSPAHLMCAKEALNEQKPKDAKTGEIVEFQEQTVSIGALREALQAHAKSDDRYLTGITLDRIPPHPIFDKIASADGKGDAMYSEHDAEKF